MEQETTQQNSEEVKIEVIDDNAPIPNKDGELRNDKGQFVKGSIPNPKGKPVGTISVIARVRQMFAEDPEMFENFVKDYTRTEKKHVTEMLDGKPKQSIDLKGDMTHTINPEQREQIEKALDGIL
jgi:hypothetical protein